MSPRQVRAGVSPALDVVCDQILGDPPRHRAARLTSAHDVVNALTKVLGTADASADLERRLRQPIPKVTSTPPITHPPARPSRRFGCLADQPVGPEPDPVRERGLGPGHPDPPADPAATHPTVASGGHQAGTWSSTAVAGARRRDGSAAARHRHRLGGHPQPARRQSPARSAEHRRSAQRRSVHRAVADRRCPHLRPAGRPPQRREQRRGQARGRQATSRLAGAP